MNYFILFIDGLQILSGMTFDDKKNAKIQILKRFIELMDEEKFNRVFKNIFIDEPDFEVAWFDFHKSMRQTDFYNIGGGHVDMLFWEFIRMSNLPYKMFKIFTEKIKVGIIGEFDDTDFNAKGWNKFGFL